MDKEGKQERMKERNVHSVTTSVGYTEWARTLGGGCLVDVAGGWWRVDSL
jgi:hypothetical protein